MLKYICRIFGLLLLCAVTCRSQSALPVHYTTADGFPSNKVYQVYRDSKGFLWFATDKGAVRYNGLHFERFTTFDGLPDNEIFSFKEDKEQRLWIGSFGGNLCYYKDNTFYTAANEPFLKLASQSPLTERITVAADSSITILFNDRLHFINIRHEKIQAFQLSKLKHRLRGNIIQVRRLNDEQYELLCDSNRTIMDTAYNIISVRPYKYNTSYSYSCSENKDYLLGKNGIYDMAERLLYPLKKLSIPKGYIVTGTGDSAFFLCTPNGLLINDSLHLLKGIQLTGICRDIENNYWITSLNNGIYRLSSDFLKSRDLSAGYTGHVKEVRSSAGSLLFLTDNNRLYRIQQQRVQYMQTVADKEQFRLPPPYCTNPFIDTYARKSVPPHCLALIRAAGVRDIYCDTDYIYGMSSGGIRYIACNKGTGNKVVTRNLFQSHDEVSRIFYWTRSPDNTIWFSTVNAVYKIVRGHLQPQQELKDNALRLFLFYKSYLVGYTHKNELLICHTEKVPMQIDTVKNENCIWDRFYPVDSNRILISTDARYRILTFSDTGYDIRPVENTFIPLHAEYIYSDSQNCYFFRNGIVSCFDKSVVFKPSGSPKVLFTGLVAGNKTYNISPEDIILPYNAAQNIHLTFNSIAFGEKDFACIYSISKNGTDDWHRINGDVINIASPGYGAYTIKIKAHTPSGKDSECDVLHLVILRPVWATWWFVLTVIILGAASSWYIVRAILRYKLGKKQKEYEREMKYRQSEFKALNALMNPHFIFNSLTNIRGLINGEDKKAAENYLMIFSRMVRQNMSNISREMISLQKELELVTNYLKLEQLRFKNLFHYSIEVSEEIETHDILIPPLMIQPLVENAIRHGLLPLQSDKAIVIIRVYETGNVICIEVADNGVGLHTVTTKEQLHESFGLQNLEQRIEHMRRIQKQEIHFTVKETRNEHNEITGTLATIKISPSSRL